MTDQKQQSSWIAPVAAATGGAIFVLAGFGAAQLMDEDSSSASPVASAAGTPSTGANASQSTEAAVTATQAATTETDSATQSQATVSTAATAGDDYCGIPGSDPTVFTDGPRDVMWVDRWGSQVPMSKRLGPSRKDGELEVCWSHTTEGALMAAIWQIYGMQNSEEYVNYGLPPGEHRDDMLEIAQDADGGMQSVAVAGFRITKAERDFVQAEVVLCGAPGMYLVAPMPMEWRDGDWRVDADEVVDPYDPGSLQGFTIWSS